jgi:hypothetical protein
MPTEIWFWLVALILIVGLGAFAIWKNGGIDVGVSLKGLVLKTRQHSKIDRPPGVWSAQALPSEPTSKAKLEALPEMKFRVVKRH